VFPFFPLTRVVRCLCLRGNLNCFENLCGPPRFCRGFQEPTTPGKLSDLWLDGFKIFIQVFNRDYARPTDNTKPKSAGAHRFLDCKWSAA